MGFWDELSGNWAIWLIPLISGLVGWGTNVLAVEMMFKPTEFRGIRPFFGWQGIVPGSAMLLAQRSTDLITGQLLTLKQLFAGFDAERMAGDMKPALDQLGDEMISEFSQGPGAEGWNRMAEPAQQVVRTLIHKEMRDIAVQVLRDIHQDIERIVDLKEVVMSTVAKERSLIAELFLEVGGAEFRFIRNSGAYFGMLFGIIQMAIWVFFPVWWILPLAGFGVGYATNWLALKLIFEPASPYKVGPVVIQGLFHKRQQEVSEKFSSNIAGRVMNPENIVRTISTGEPHAVLMGIVERRIKAMLDKYASNPMMATLMPEGERESFQRQLKKRMAEELPRPGGFLYSFADGAMDIRGEIHRRMSSLDPKNFEGVLRPAFQQDEWKLIVIGAVLGLGAGFLQLVTLFGEVWAQV